MTRSGVLRWLPVVAAILRRPDLWVTGVRVALRLAPRGWWQQAPRLPLPDADYLRFRLATMYGDPDATPKGSDLVEYLEWCRAWPHLSA